MSYDKNWGAKFDAMVDYLVPFAKEAFEEGGSVAEVRESVGNLLINKTEDEASFNVFDSGDRDDILDLVIEKAGV